MEDIDFTIIYNEPEEISGLGCGAHFIGLCLFFVLALCIIPDALNDNTLIKNLINTIISSGILITLSWVFILILCPIYFFIRFVMELIRYKRCKYRFYSTPNIEYIKLNNDDIFFKNTYSDYDISIRKQDITEVTLDGKIKSISTIKATGTLRVTTFVENLMLTIKTANEVYIIHPAIKLKRLRNKYMYIDEIELLKQQIEFYKTYFDNFKVLFNLDGTDKLTEYNEFSESSEIPEFLRKS